MPRAPRARGFLHIMAKPNHLHDKLVKMNIPAPYSTESVDAEDKIIHAKLFALGSAATWLVAEYDPEDKVIFCYCDLYGTGPHDGAEWGYTSIEELESLMFGIIPRIEIDTNFDPLPFRECRNEDKRIRV